MSKHQYINAKNIVCNFSYLRGILEACVQIGLQI